MVAGFDLRNEVRPAHGVAAEWGNGGKTDFALACEKTGNMILEVKIGNKKIYAISNRICVFVFVLSKKFCTRHVLGLFSLSPFQKI